MTFNFTTNFIQNKVQEMLPRNANIVDWFAALNEVLPKYEITSVERIAAFMAQCAHESLDFTVLEENLNYSEIGLLRIFPKYFDSDSAAAYARQPEKIANIVYANRMGNGNTASGDGWTYRGRGIIQLTGRANYTAATNDIYGTQILIEHPWVIMKPEVAVEVACWFWNRNRLNRLADQDDIDAITYRINGGYTGKEERADFYNRNKNILA